MRSLTAFSMLSLALAAPAWSSAGEDNGSATKVKVSARAGSVDEAGKQTIILTMTIDKDWHIYANPVRYSILNSVQTIVRVAAGEKSIAAKVLYPAGKLHVDKINPDARYMAYEDTVAIPVQVRRGENDGPLEVSVRFVACDDKKCLAQSTRKLTVP